MTNAKTNFHRALVFTLFVFCPFFITSVQGAPLPSNAAYDNGSDLLVPRSVAPVSIDNLLAPVASRLSEMMMPPLSCPSGACIQVGPRLASLDSNRGALLNALFTTLLGNSVNLTVLDWNSIAGADISLLELLTALETNLTLSSPAEALTTNITVLQLLTAAADVAEADGNTAAASALGLLANIPGLTGTIQLGDLLQVAFPVGALADIDLDLLDLVTGSIQLYNYDNVATTPTPVTIDDAGLLGALGLGGVVGTGGLELYAQVVEPPVIVCGPTGTTAHSATIRIKLNVDLLDIALDVSDIIALPGIANASASLADVNLYLEIARADAVITGIDPIAQTVTVDATPGVVDVYLGEIADAVFFNRSSSSATIQAALDYGTVGEISVTLVTLASATGNIQVRSSAHGDAVFNSMLNFSGAYPETQTAHTSATFGADLISDPVEGDGLMQNLELQLSGGPLLTLLGGLLTDVVNTLKPIVTNALTPPLRTLLSNLVDPVLELLGIQIGEAVVTVFGAFFADQDCDDDGIPNDQEGASLNRDTDQDGYPDYLDRDSDGDGIADVIEAGGPDAGAIDANGDGVLDDTNDEDGDGLADSVDPDSGGTPLSNLDSDDDGYANVIDIDADGDGIPDLIEAQTSNGVVFPTGTDTDQDGLDDAFDPTNGGTGIVPYDHEFDNTPDYLDLDSDDDGAGDLTEGHDMNENGVIDGAERSPTPGQDADGDGLDDGFEGEYGASYAPGNTSNASNGISDPPADMPNVSDGTDNPTEPDFRDNLSLLPVELVAFDAKLDGDIALLTWSTTSETNNAGFEVQIKHVTGAEQTDETWNVLAFTDGHGTTEQAQSYSFRVDDLAPGRHTFRLKQIDYDGTFDYSPEVEVVVEMAERFVMEAAYPNPFNPQATMRFAVNRSQAVEVAMYDMLGRQVQVLWSGEAEAGRMQEVRIDGSGLPSGVYLVRAVGNGFAQTQRVTLIK